MSLRLALFALSSLVCLSAGAQKPTLPPPRVLKVVTDRPEAMYQVGDPVTFTITSTDPAITTVSCVLSEDGWAPQPAQSVTLTAGKGTITGSLKQPGFLLLHVSAGKSSAMAGAGFEPLKITPSLPVPEDFNAFWASQKAALAQVPLKSKLTPVTTPAKGVDAFDVQVDCLGASVSGYFGRPQNAKPKSLPAILFVHGAGVNSSSLNSTYWAAREGGMLSLDINAHGIANGQPPEFYKALSAGALQNYRFEGRDDREKNYFKGMFLRLVRALDFLTAQPEWDGKTLIVHGSSQGGFQAFAAAGLDERVTFICAGVPAGCDHSGMVAQRIAGWPKLVSMKEGKPVEAELQTARYVDAMNFATRVKVKGAAVSVGLIDTTCPPTSIYAAYNALPCVKAMHVDPLTGHQSTPGASKFLQEAALAHVRAMK